MKKFLLSLLLLLGVSSVVQGQPPSPTQCVTTVAAGGTGDQIQFPTIPCWPTTTLVIMKVGAANTTTTPAISVNGGPFHTVVNYDGSSIPAGTFQPGQYRMLAYNGTNWLALSAGVVFNVNGFVVTPTNATLKAIVGATNGETVYRAGFTNPGDGGSADYTFTSGTNCSISGGDNGSQVQPTAQTGCYNIATVATGVDDRVFGAVPGTDATTVTQLAINYAQSAHIPLLLGGQIYEINATGLTCTAPLTIDGGNPGSSGTVGIGGFQPTSLNETILTAAAGCNGSKFKNIWLNMGVVGTNTGGNGTIVLNQGTSNILLDNITSVSACTTVQMNGFNPWITNSYFQHSAGGAGCHPVWIGHQSNGSAGHTTGGGLNNVLISGTAPIANTVQQGILLEDCGGCLMVNVQTIFGTNGLDVHPGGTSGAGQLVASLYFINGTPGDTTVSTNVDINPTTAFGVVRIIHIVHSSISSNSTNTIFGAPQANPEVNIHNDNGGIVRSIVLDGDTIYAGNIGVNIGSGVSDVTLVNNHVCGYGTNLTGGNYFGVWMGSTAFDIKINNNTIEASCDANLFGTPGYAFHFDANSPYGVVIVGNQLAPQVTDWSDDTYPGFNATFPALLNVISANGGLSGSDFSQPSATTVDTKINSQILITGTTPTITTLTGCWPGRQLSIYDNVAGTFGTGGNIGAAFTMTANVPAVATCFLVAGIPTWFLK